MRQLTKKEKEIMEFFWDRGPMFVRELQSCYDKQPNFSTLSTQVHTLQVDGFLDREAFGSNYRYFPVVSAREYCNSGIHGLIDEYLDSQYSSVVMGFVKNEKLSVDDLKRIIDKIEKGQ
ncbi:MAG: BlaI/MecI/CopY family transcriptional regulator [Bacteroidaceae bacterium]|jgi:predicted transcriptional regulator|nr:BlaI/MecI/CopY family transcriptional regulator [Bacteroidaceae bacterium]